MTGLFGVAGVDNVIHKVFYGTDYHSHLGTRYGGIAYVDEKGDTPKKIHDISNTQFKSKFDDLTATMRANLAIGVISDKDPQPLNFVSKFGPFAICMSGLIINKNELKEEMIRNGMNFSEVYRGDINQADLVANLINEKATVPEGISHMWDIIDGSASLLFLTPEGIYAARDRHGVTTLCIGTDGTSWAVTSESCAFPNLGYEMYKELSPGEVVLLSPNGPKTVLKGKGRTRICAFLWVYTGFPASSYEGINTEVVRERSGSFLAKRDSVEADLAAGVPDSGTAHAIGYAMESRIPYRRVLMKYTPGYGRSYTPLTQEERDRVATMKLIPNEATIKGNRIVLCEDSIVRGTQLKNFTVNKLRNAGAKEVHVRPACPPLMFPCKYMLSTRNISELVARRAIKALEGRDIEDISPYLNEDGPEFKRMVEWIRKDLDLDSLRYQRLNDMIEAIGLKKEELCLYCWNGEEV